jgi:hypothetical protein
MGRSFGPGERSATGHGEVRGKVEVYLSQEAPLMRFASPLVGLSAFAALCGSAHAQTPSPPAPAGTYDEQAIGVRNLGAANRETPPSGERPDWMYAEGKWDAFRGPDHHPITQEAFYRIVGREDLLFRY